MSVNLNINTNQVFVSSSQNQIIVEDRNQGVVLNIEQPIDKIIEVTSPGPRGPKGDQGDSLFTDIGNNLYSTTSSLEITGSLLVTNGITGSLQGTSSFAINSSTASFARNASTTSFAPNYTTTSSFNAFTSSYNTGSFTGSFTGDGSGLYDIPASGIVGLNLSQISSGSVSASISPNNGLQVNTNVTATSFTGSLQGVATTASFAPNYTLTSSFNVFTASYNTGSFTGSFIGRATGSFTGSFTGSLFGTASYATNASTASNILGGKATHIPFFITDTTLATSSLYQSGSTTVVINQDNATEANPEALYVWQPSTTSFNVISGKGNLNNYLQLNIQNTNNGDSGSSDVVATANNGDESSNYIDMGINGENYAQNFIGNANDAYLYSTGNDLHIGNASNFSVQIFAGGSDVDVHNKLELSPNDQHLMSGSLDVSGSIKAFSFTGSLQGNAASATTSQTSSYSTTLGASLSQPANNQVRLLNSAGGTLSTVTVNNVTSASHADNATTADSATYAANAGNGGVTQLIAGSGITLLPSNGQGAVTVVAGAGGGVTIISGSLVTGSFVNSTSFTFNHDLGTRTPIITVFDSNYNQIIPENIQLVDTASAIITFPTQESGFAIGSTGGTTGTALSSSYALFSTYADTASFYAETDPVFVAKSGSLATTGSNVFRGNQTVTGSLFTSGSNTLIGTTTLTGSLSITGSTTQTGNNTLIGTTTLTGSIQIAGDVIPQLSSSFDLGSLTNPWRSIYVQSGSISIQSDIPGGIPAVISNANGNVTFTGAGFQLKSGSFVPFEVTSTARTVIRVPNLPAGDIGGLSIIGSSTGAYQPVTNAGGLLHLTSNDEQSARLTVDAFGSGSFVSYVSRKARGTAASPLPVQAGDVMLRMATAGWTGTGYGISTPGVAAATTFEIVALDNFTTSSIGSRMHFYNAPSGSVTRTLSATIDTTGITIPSSSRLFGTASWAENAQTASFLPVGTYNITSSWAVSASQAVSASFAQTASYVRPLTQDVIITGSLKVSGSLTEIGDTVLSGSLTLSSGSALRINNGFYVDGQKQFNYGQFSSTQTQSGSADTAYSMTFNTTDFSNGVTLVSGSRLTVANTGTYNIQFSSQLHTTANQAVDFSIWFAMTGSNVANSNTDFTVEKIAGGGFAVAALNFLTQMQSGSYIELKYSKTTLEGQLQAKGTQASPSRPATPSAIVTVTQIA